MSTLRTVYAKQWMDDYLDLLNYAVSIGDKEWQKDLLQAMSQMNLHIDDERKQQLKDELWRRYDCINKQLLGLYSELRSTNRSEQTGLLDLLIELKQKRLEISKQLESIG